MMYHIRSNIFYIYLFFYFMLCSFSFLYFIFSCTSGNALFYTLDAFSNYHLKDKNMKGKISKDLLVLLPMIPKDIVLNKVLSLLKQAHGFDSESSAYLVPIVAKVCCVEIYLYNLIDNTFMS